MTVTAVRNGVYDVITELVVWECPVCGIVYGVPKDFADSLRRTGGHYYCPNGDRLSWRKTESDELREKLKTEQKASAFWRSQTVAAESREATAKRQAAAAKGQLTKLRKRTGHGVCPVKDCKRSFANVRRHVEHQHPEYIANLEEKAHATR